MLMSSNMTWNDLIAKTYNPNISTSILFLFELNGYNKNKDKHMESKLPKHYNPMSQM